MGGRPKAIWEIMAEQTFNAREQILVSMRQEMGWPGVVVGKRSARQSAARLVWHALKGTSPQPIRCAECSTGQIPAVPHTPILELPVLSQIFTDSIVPVVLQPRATVEAIVEEAMAGTTYEHEHEPPPNAALAARTRWFASDWMQSAKWLNDEVSDPGKDRDIECQLKPDSSPGQRHGHGHGEDKVKLRRIHREIAWITWLLFVVYVTYIANIHMYILS